MNDSVAEPLIRLASFAAVFAVVATAESYLPRRTLTIKKSKRWTSNLGLMVINTIAARIVLPIGAVGMALIAEENGWGLFNNVGAPPALAVVLCVLGLDLTIYLQHVLFHAVPVLWRVHRVHHADLDFDATTGVRFHVIEILLSLAIKLLGVLFLGAPALAVLIFEITLNATSMFNHANLRLPSWLDRVLRWFIVTPDMHRVHHSALPAETDSNFGFNFPWWDFVFGSYRAQPMAGHEAMKIGLSEFRDALTHRLSWLLLLPFISSSKKTATNGVNRTDSSPGGEESPEFAPTVSSSNDESDQTVCK